MDALLRSLCCGVIAVFLIHLRLGRFHVQIIKKEYKPKLPAHFVKLAVKLDCIVLPKGSKVVLVPQLVATKFEPCMNQTVFTILKTEHIFMGKADVGFLAMFFFAVCANVANKAINLQQS